MEIVVAESCVGCALCMLVCPSKAIRVLGRAIVDEACNACMKCIDCCPNSSILLRKS